jgi:hypothetical protein
MEWGARLDVFRSAMQSPGEAFGIRIVVTGRPTEVKRREGFVIATVVRGDPWPNLSRELPVPPDLPTTYKVCIVMRHWRKIETSLRINATDSLLVEGYAVPNPQQPIVVVFATNATTRHLQKLLKTRQFMRGLS